MNLHHHSYCLVAVMVTCFVLKMIVVQPAKNHFLHNSKSIKKPIPLPAVLLYKLFYVLFGFDFGFFGNLRKKQHCLLKIVTVTPIFILYQYSVVAVFHFNVLGASLYSYYLLQYITCVIIFMTTNNQLYNFLVTLKSIDAKLCSEEGSLLKTLMFIVVIIFVRTSISFTWCTFQASLRCVEPQWALFLFFVMVYCHDFLLLTNSLVFHLVYGRLVTLCHRLENADTTEALFKYNQIYKSITDTTELIKKSFDPLLFTSILFNVPENMAYVYSLVFLLSNNLISFRSTSLYVATLSVLGTIILTTLPALFAGRLTSQAYNVRVILTDKLLSEQDEKKSKCIEKFINYVETRPLKFYIYKVVPLNAKLLGIVVNFFLTYLIVIIQLTHLY